VARHRRGRRSFDRPQADRSFDTGKQTKKEEAKEAAGRPRGSALRALFRFKHEGSDEFLPRGGRSLPALIRSSILQDDQANQPIPLFDRAPGCPRIDVERPAVSSCRLSWLVRPAMTATPRTSSGTATSVRAHARPSPRSSTQGLLLCFPTHRLACTQCHLAGTKPTTRTPASPSAATPAIPDVRVQSRMTCEEGREFSARFEMECASIAPMWIRFGYLPSKLRRLLESPFIHDIEIDRAGGLLPFAYEKLN